MLWYSTKPMASCLFDLSLMEHPPAPFPYAMLCCPNTGLSCSTSCSTSAFTKVASPILKSLETLFTHAGTDVDETGLEVFKEDGSDLVDGGVEEGFAEVAEGPHGGVFGQRCYVGAGEACVDNG